MPLRLTRPTLAGLAQPGSVLSAQPGRWQPRPASVTYTWRRCNPNSRACLAIEGATGTAYRLAAADVGHTLVVVETASTGTATQSAYSVASPIVR